MTHTIIQTEWPQWDKYLSKYANKKITCLVVGAHNGKYTEWLLNNLCMNNYSRVFSVDKWDPTIEKDFDNIISKSLHKDKHIKMNMKIAKALLKLKEVNYLSFDIILINKSIDAKKLLINTILCWDMLIEGGTLLFTDYNINDIDIDLSIKLTIDSFVSIYASQIKLIYSGYEYILEKINKRDNNHPELEEYYKLLDKINYFIHRNIMIKYDDNINDDIEYKLQLSTKQIDEKRIIPNAISNIDNLHLLPLIYKVNIKNQNIIKIINNLYDPKLINNVNNLIKVMQIDIKLIFIIIRYNFIIKYLNKITSTKNIFIIDYILDNNIYQDIYNYSKCKHKTNITFNNIVVNTITIYNKIINSNKKYSYMVFGYIKEFNYPTTKYAYVFVLYYVGLILNCLELDGSSVIYIPYWLNKNLLYDIIYLLKINFKHITIENKLHSNINTHYLLYCNEFINKSNNIDSFNQLIYKIYNEEIYHINKFLFITNYDSYNNYIIKTNNYINIMIDTIINVIDLYKQIYNYMNNNKIVNSNNILLSLIKQKLNVIYDYYIKNEYLKL